MTVDFWKKEPARFMGERTCWTLGSRMTVDFWEKEPTRFMGERMPAKAQNNANLMVML